MAVYKMGELRFISEVRSARVERQNLDQPKKGVLGHNHKWGDKDYY